MAENSTIDNIEQCGRVQFSTAETALFCEITESELCNNEEYSNAWLKGRVQGEALARNEILKAARNGDISACRQLLQLAERSRPELEEDESEDNAEAEDTE